MLPDKLAFVDIETTGLGASHNRIIEIGIIRVENNEIVQTYHSLINPETRIAPEIEKITGITTSDLEDAPTFRSIKTDILETLIDATFVAHNVRFDYGFLKNEFKRENISFSSRQFCTVKLSRFLYPTHRRHNLDAIIERFAIKCEKRHRALDDAKVLYAFYQKIQQSLPIERIAEAINHCSKQPTLPVKLQKSFLDSLPENPGVYLFYDGQNMPLYIGKSINIKDRVLSHFASDITSPTEMNIAQQIERIETISTAGELGALILESQLIKKLLPVYNKKSRYKRELIALKKITTEDGYDTVQMEVFQANNFQNTQKTQTTQKSRKSDFQTFRQSEQSDTLSFPSVLNFETLLGFFKSHKHAKTYLAEIAKKYSLCEKLLGLEKTKNACFAHRLGRCKGACVGKEKPLFYNTRTLLAFSKTKMMPWPFSDAIIIEENDITNRQEYFVVDQWCLIGSIVVDAEGNKKTTMYEDTNFDFDLYRIIQSYLKKPLSRQNIKIVPRQELLSFFAD